MDVGRCESKLLQAERHECDLAVLPRGFPHHPGIFSLHAACAAAIGDLVCVGRLGIVLEG